MTSKVRAAAQRAMLQARVASVKALQPRAYATQPLWVKPVTTPLENLPGSSPSSKGEQKQSLTRITTLPNGIRIASEDSYGLVSTVGVFVDAGSRCETAETAGAAQLVDLLTLRGTKNLTAEQLSDRSTELGGQLTSAASREHMSVFASVLRHNVPDTIELLAEVIKNPAFSSSDLEIVKGDATHHFFNSTEKPDMFLGELVHTAAYGNESLGRPLISFPENLHGISLDAVKRFRDMFYRPERLIVVGAGVDHDELVNGVKNHFSNGWSSSLGPVNFKPAPAKYVGQELILPDDRHPDMHVMLAFEGVSFHDADLYTVAVLQFLLGGGTSFSAGGPGKGMYSRLYTRVLNQYHWVQAATNQSIFYTDSGLFTIYGSCEPSKSTRFMRLLLNELHILTKEVDLEELQRAKNQLKSSLLMNLESKFVEFEDIGKQVQAYGRRIIGDELLEKIDCVSPLDIRRTMSRILSKHPCMAATGSTDLLPSLQQVSLM